MYLSLRQKQVSYEQRVSLPELVEALLRPQVLGYSGCRHSLASPGREEAWTGSLAESENREHGNVDLEQGLHDYSFQVRNAL